MELSKEQVEFLTKHKIALKDTFNAVGLPRAVYQMRMRELDKLVAFGVTPCKNGHQLRSRSGHCIQCNPAAIQYTKRNAAGGFLYIAGTAEGKLIKIGYTANTNSRKESINRTKYGGYKDWETLCSVECQEAGKIENELISLLSKYAYKRTYGHDGKEQETYELFSCSYQSALDVLKDVLIANGYETTLVKERKFLLAKYQFPNRSLIKK